MTTLEEVLYCVELTARRFHVTEDARANMVARAWWLWSRYNTDERDASYFAFLAYRNCATGDLPGCSMRKWDVHSKLKRVNGAGMENLKDREPTAAKVHEAKDMSAKLRSILTFREKIVFDWFQSGETSISELEDLKGWNRGTGSYARGCIFEKWKSLQ